MMTWIARVEMETGKLLWELGRDYGAGWPGAGKIHENGMGIGKIQRNRVRMRTIYHTVSISR